MLALYPLITILTSLCHLNSHIPSKTDASQKAECMAEASKLN